MVGTQGMAIVLAAVLAMAWGPKSPPKDKAPEADTGAGVQLLQVCKIWDEAPHNAFTDLVWHQGRFWCVFREGKGHVSRDGALRVISSTDGVTWKSAARVTSHIEDLRDPKLTLTPGGRFMLSGAGALHQPMPHTHQSYVWFSEDGRDWGAPQPVGDPGYWLWRMTWHKDACYAIGYNTGKEKNIRLYRSLDGRKFETLDDNLYDLGFPNESALVFEPDGTARCLLRRDPEHGLLGISPPPYVHWEWRDVGRRIGGPCLLRLPDGRLIAAVRLYDGKVRTALVWVNPETGHLSECLKLPSGGDTSYAGLAWHAGLLYVSYYSSHENKTTIYLARVKVE